MTQVKRAFTLCVCLVLLLTMGGGIFLSAFAVRANAATVQYSSVLEDLEKDEAFDAAMYPEVSGDYSLSVIHLAESVNGEVFLYVYQPSKSKVATCVNMSIGKGNVDYRFYTLSLLNSDGVFFKYKVNDLIVGTENSRQYDVVSILRAWEEGIDKDVDPITENTINEVAFKVAKCYTYTDFPTPALTVEDLEVITVTDKFVGFMRYPDFSYFGVSQVVDAHFIAFSTDMKIDNLLQADVYYQTQSSSYFSLTKETEYGVVESHIANLLAEKDLIYDGSAWLSASYNWRSIETAASFLESEADGQMYKAGIFNVNVLSIVDETAKSAISSKEWVLRFAATVVETVDYPTELPSYEQERTIVSNVSILRLAFKTEGVPYNLGVIDNKQTGSEEPSNTIKTEVDWSESFEKIIALLMLVLLMAFIGPFLAPLLSVAINIFWLAVKSLLSLILWAMGLPFRLFSRLFWGK